MMNKIRKLLVTENFLKARDIAKKLGVDKSEVNSFLYQHDDTFVKDDKHRWSLKSNQISVEFPSHWVDCSSFEDSLLQSGLSSDSFQSVNFIFPNNCKLMLEAIARLLALCNQLVRLDKEVVIDLSNNNDSLGYLNRSGFFDHLDKKICILPDRPKTSTAKLRKGNNERLVEFGSVDPKSNNKELVKQLSDAFVILSSKVYEDAAFTIFSELVGNIKEHSESILNGFAALQKYNGRTKSSCPHIQTVISDSGVGIAATLRPNLKIHYPKLLKLSDLDLVKKAMSEGQISKHGSNSDSGHGMGFKSSKEKALKFDARYSVRQNSFSLEFIFMDGKLQAVKERDDLVNILGTHLCFDFDIDESECAD